MQPFQVREAGEAGETAATAVHTPTAECPACVDGYPTACPRIIGQGFQPVGFDAAGQATGSVWTVTTCAGMVHAEIGMAGVLERRCAACGVPA